VLCEKCLYLGAIRALGALPVAVFRKLRQPCAAPGSKLVSGGARGTAVGFDGVAPPGGAVLLLAADAAIAQSSVTVSATLAARNVIIGGILKTATARYL